MAEKRTALRLVLALIGMVFVGFVLLRVTSSIGFFPFAYTMASTPRELLEFLESRTAHVKGIKVNGHLLEIGKRPSLQVIRGYGQVMYQMRPYRQVSYKYRNLTLAEVMDFCFNINNDSLEELRSAVDSGSGYKTAWKGNVMGKDIVVVRVTRFTYLITGLANKALFMGQVELAKRLGMSDQTILKVLIPVQYRWLDGVKSLPSIDSPFRDQSPDNVEDAFIEWLSEK